MFCLYSGAMLEPSPRFSAGGVGGGGGGTGQSLQIDTHHSGLETAVDLSRKTEAGGDIDADQEESDDDAPLDLKVRPRTGSCSSSISVGGKPLHLSDIQRAEQSMPNLQQRAELLRIAEAMHTSSTTTPHSAGLPLPPNFRSSSQEREMPSESACSLCGADTQSPDFRPSDHGENLCGRGTISCPLCAKTFSLWSHYEAHKKCHQKLKQRQYPCQTCGKIFTSASNRNMHQRIHKGVRPFQCAPCGVFFRQKAHLQKHQKTQGHIQASEIYEKKKREGLINEDSTSSSSGKGSSPIMMHHRPDSVKSDVDSMSGLSLLADSTSLLSHLPHNNGSSSSSLIKSSPKRKQAKPSQVLVSENNNDEEEDLLEDEDEDAELEIQDAEDSEDACPVSTSEDKLNAFIDYNDKSHGYDCNQCTFDSHDLSVMKEHIRDEHMAIEREDKLKCRECQITFSKEFNLRIHNRKHATSSQFLPCDYCEQVFKVPNKLIKHMEAVHSVCPTCGDKQDDKASLLRHLDTVHEENSPQKQGFHASLLQFTPLMSHLSSPTTSSSLLSLENRMAKKRKVDSLAEVIRQKQELKSKSLSPPEPKETQPLLHPGHKHRRKNLEAFRSPTRPASQQQQSIAEALLHLQPQPLSKISPELLHHHAKRSENNNVLSSLANLKLPPSIKLPTRPVAGLTPPSSPPPTTEIRAEVTIMAQSDNESDNEAEPAAGLDLSISKRRNSDEHEVTSTRQSHPALDLYGRLALAAPHPPHHLPFPFLPPLHHGADPGLAEHLLKLASLQGRGPPPLELAKPPSSSPYTVLSAMLGHHAPPNPHHYPTVFPGMPSVFPPAAAAAVSSPLVASSGVSIKEEPNSKLAPSSNSEKKPFVCNFCRKEFGHLSSLESHMDHMHSGDSKHTCDTCGKSFSSKSNLTAHRKIHSGERPFECVVCHKRFRQKAHLQKHETTHSSATPYKCSVCDKAFGHISNLNTHMATHSNVRPYQCADCGKSYKDSASFKRHRLGHTGERPYNCDLCDETFIDSKAVRRHREVAHPNDPPKQSSEDSTFEEEEVDDDEDMSEEVTPSTSAYSSFESAKDCSDLARESEEIEVEKEMEEDDEELEEEIDPEGS